MQVPSRTQVQWFGLISGPILGLLTAFLLPSSYASIDDVVAFTTAGRATAGLGIWMATWWMTEAIPVYATALLPLAILPTAQAVSIKEAAAPYGHPLIFMFMGGFILALAMERWGLHKRIAFTALRCVGTRPRNIVGGFMVITAVLSMWVSNTATTIMMLPIATSVIALTRTAHPNKPESTRPNDFSTCLLLGIAYAASIGGIGTLIGTPPNLFLASFVRSNLNQEISFSAWMLFAIPLVVLFLPVVWVLLTRYLYPVSSKPIAGGSKLIAEAHKSLGRPNTGERITFVVFMLTATSWIARPYLAKWTIAGHAPLAGLTDTGIAMISAIALFLMPVNLTKRIFAIDWPTATRLPWGLLILFGGGLSLASAIQKTGVGEFIGAQVSALQGLPVIVLILAVVAIMIFLTELTSNTATTATLIPILAAIAPSLDLNPLLLIVPAAVAASCAFMLPVATPPNAIIFGSGRVSINQMSRAGLYLNLIGILLITGLCYALVLRIFAQ